MISKIAPRTPISFIDTGYHFPETLLFVEKIQKLLQLDIVKINSEIPKINQLNTKGLLLYSTDPDSCCHINKVLPQKFFLKDYDVWVSGIRRDQTTNRRSFMPIEETTDGVLRVHPMLDWNLQMINDYIDCHELPRHPMDQNSCLSIGCMPCTNLKNTQLEHGRDQRWEGQTKTECGLHLGELKK